MINRNAWKEVTYEEFSQLVYVIFYSVFLSLWSRIELWGTAEDKHLFLFVKVLRDGVSFKKNSFWTSRSIISTYFYTEYHLTIYKGWHGDSVHPYFPKDKITASSSYLSPIPAHMLCVILKLWPDGSTAGVEGKASALFWTSHKERRLRMLISSTHGSVALDHTQPVICYGWIPSTEEFLSKINTLDWQYFRVMLYKGKKTGIYCSLCLSLRLVDYKW